MNQKQLIVGNTPTDLSGPVESDGELEREDPRTSRTKNRFQAVRAPSHDLPIVSQPGPSVSQRMLSWFDGLGEVSFFRPSSA